MRVRPLLAAAAACAIGLSGLALAAAAPATAQGGARVFLPGAVLNADHTVTLALRHGRSGGRDVWYTVTEASDSGHASTWRASVAQKLANAKGTAAVQKVTLDPDGTVVFPATVDFSPAT